MGHDPYIVSPAPELLISIVYSAALTDTYVFYMCLIYTHIRGYVSG